MESESKKCYIAGKITGLSDEDFTANFKTAAEEVKIIGMTPISPIELTHNHDRSWLNYMREDLTEMLKCDCVYALRNYKDSRGASIEVNLAISLGINVIYQR